MATLFRGNLDTDSPVSSFQVPHHQKIRQADVLCVACGIVQLSVRYDDFAVKLGERVECRKFPLVCLLYNPAGGDVTHTTPAGA